MQTKIFGNENKYSILLLEDWVDSDEIKDSIKIFAKAEMEY